ncbi:hypothetical protein [Caulobacter sp. Root487D2Y]|uniref:hypothetical protein n=1 Tax=Caulobacter sp. Root487D2Y TaxID=1736547 RepID=UPI0012E3397B|nr:hypothetical protein [Caulobacter sp. Root487D2Y]
MSDFWTWAGDKVVPGLVIAVTTALVAPWALERHRGRRDAVFRATDALQTRLDKIYERSVDYWLRDHDAEKDPSAEHHLQHLLADVTTFVRQLGPDLFEVAEAQGNYKLAMLADAVTGGEFLSRRRVADPQRLSQISVEMHSLTRFILGRRKRWLDYWWPTAMWQRKSS